MDNCQPGNSLENNLNNQDDNFCFKNEVETNCELDNSEQKSVCVLPNVCRIWKRRRLNGIKPGKWDDMQTCQYDYWDPNSPFKEHEEISQMMRCNVFPGYTYNYNRGTSYNGDFSADVFKKRCESQIPDEFRRRSNETTKWAEKLIVERLLRKDMDSNKVVKQIIND